METVVTEFLSALKVPISKAYVRRLVRAHPDFPSLVSVSDVLTRIGVNHVAHRIETSELINIPFPYMLPLDKGKGDLLLIKNGRDLDKNKERLRQWGGVVLQAEKVANVRDKVGSTLYQEERQIRILGVFISSIIAFPLAYRVASIFSWSLLFLTLTSAAGLVVGYLILAKQLGMNFKAVDKFCNSGKQTNCDKILESDVKFFGVHLSDAVLIYFLFQFLSTIFIISFASIAQTFWLGLEVLGWCSIPFVAFSLYYQKVVAKIWCRLCLIVSALIILQSFIFLGKWSTTDFLTSIENGIDGKWIFFFLLIAIVSSTAMLIKHLVNRSIELDASARDSNNLKHSSEVFRHFLFKQKKIDVQPVRNDLVIGDSTAPIHIVMVSNLYCQPCKERHQSVHELLLMYPDLVRVTLRFVRSGNDLVNNTHSVRYLLSLWLEKIKGRKNESELALKMLHDWFGIWDFEKFKRSYVLTGDADQEATDLENTSYLWIDRNEIHLTPTFIVNGYKLPIEYTIDDLKGLMVSLAHEQRQPETAVLP